MNKRFALLLVAGNPLLAFSEPVNQPDLELGAYLSGECSACHISGRQNGAIPAITNLPSADFVMAMQDYKRHIRDNVVMQKVSARLSDDDIAALAAYFETLNETR